MAKTKEELAAITAGIKEELKDLEPQELLEIAKALKDEARAAGKDSVSLNYEEDTEPVDFKDMAKGLRNY